MRDRLSEGWRGAVLPGKEGEKEKKGRPRVGVKQRSEGKKDRRKEKTKLNGWMRPNQHKIRRIGAEFQ